MSLAFHATNLSLFAKSGGRPSVFISYSKHLLEKLAVKFRGDGTHSVSDLMAPIDQRGTFTTAWFNRNAPEWMNIFSSEQLTDKPINVLEIGSWEGRSTCFALHYLKAAHVTAVDTWMGGDEHAGDSRLMQAEALFDANMARFPGRITKVKSRSTDYFLTKDPELLFDVIYVDGSHFVDDVMMDAVQAFAALKPGGILIFDDYTWAFYDNIKHNPAFAINCFLRMKKGEYKILSVTEQLCIKKLAMTSK